MFRWMTRTLAVFKRMPLSGSELFKNCSPVSNTLRLKLRFLRARPKPGNGKRSWHGCEGNWTATHRFFCRRRAFIV